MRVVAIHLLKPFRPWEEDRETLCGIRGTRSDDVDSEIMDPLGDRRYDIAIHGQKPTCKKCARKRK
jgi:hypothetical protein